MTENRMHAARRQNRNRFVTETEIKQMKNILFFSLRLIFSMFSVMLEAFFVSDRKG